MDFISKLIRGKKQPHVEHVCIKTEKSEKRNSSSDTDVDFIHKVVEELVDRIPEKSSTTPKASSCRSSVSNDYGFALEQEDASKRYLDTDTDVTEYESAADTELSGKLSSSASLLTFSDQLNYEPREENCSCSLSDSNRKLECVCSLKQTQSLGSIGDIPLSDTANKKEHLVLDTVHLDSADVCKPFPPLNVQLSDTLSPTSSCASPDNNFVLVEETSNVHFGTSDEGNSSYSLDFDVEQNNSELRNSTSEELNDCINQNHWNVISFNQDLVSDTNKNHSEKYKEQQLQLENENTPIKHLIDHNIKELNTVSQEIHPSDETTKKLEESTVGVISTPSIKEVDKELSVSLYKTLESDHNRECAISEIKKELELSTAKIIRNSKTDKDTVVAVAVAVADAVADASDVRNNKLVYVPAEVSRESAPLSIEECQEPVLFPTEVDEEPVAVPIEGGVGQETVHVPISSGVGQETVHVPISSGVDQETVHVPISSGVGQETVHVPILAEVNQGPVPGLDPAEEKEELGPALVGENRGLASVPVEVSLEPVLVLVPDLAGENGELAAVRAEVSKEPTSIPAEVSRDTSCVVDKISQKFATTSSVTEVRQGSDSVVNEISREPVVASIEVINQPASVIHGVRSESFSSANEIYRKLNHPTDLHRELAGKVSTAESHACEGTQISFAIEDIGTHAFTEIKKVNEILERPTDLDVLKGSKSLETASSKLGSDPLNGQFKKENESLNDSNRQAFERATQRQETEFNLQFQHNGIKTNKIIHKELSEEGNEEPTWESNKKQNWVSSCENFKEENKDLFSGSSEKIISIHDISPASNLGSSLFDSFGDQSSSSRAEITKEFPDLDGGKTSQSESLAVYVSENFSFVAAEASRIAEDIFNALEDLDSDDTISKEFKMSSLGDIDSDLDSNYPKSQCDETSNSLPQNYYVDGDSDTSNSSLLTKKAQDDLLKETSCKTRRSLEINNAEAPSKLKDSSSGECTGGNVDENSKSSSDLKKESLYNKLDNLVDMVNHSSSQTYLEDDSLTSDKLDDNENARTSLQKDDFRNTSNKNQALEFVDKLLGFSSTSSPRNRSANSGDDTQKNDTKNQESAKNSIPSNVSNIDLQKLSQLREAILQQDFIHKEEIKKYHRRMKSLEEREQQLGRKMMENSQGQQQMSLILEEYEKTISRLVAEKEHERQTFDIEKENLIKEKDAVSGHLSNIEIAFSDVHQKYEKSKQVIQGFKNNEEALRATVNDYEIALKKQEQKYEILKSHAMNQLESANQELIAMRRTHEAENSKLKAMLKKAEIKIHSLEETLQQKIKENQELVNICDELIGKVGSNE